MILPVIRAGLLAVAVLLSGQAAADTDADVSFFEGDVVEKLTRDTFISSVLESRTPATVWFFSPTECSQCGEIAKIYETAAKKLTAWGMTVGVVNVDEETKLAKELGVPKFPPYMNMYHGSSTPNPYGGLPVRPHENIPFVKDARGLQKQILNFVPDKVLSADISESGDSLKEALSSGGSSYAAVFVTTNGKASPMMRMLASEIAGKVDAVQVHVPDNAKGDDAKEETHRLAALQNERERVTWVFSDALGLAGGLPSVPALVVADKTAKTAVVYDGNIADAKAMMAFIRDNAKVLSTSPIEGDPSTDGDALPVGGVIALDPEKLTTLQEQGVEALVVAFVESPGGEEGMEAAIPGWEKGTKALQGQIRAAVMDCGVYPSDVHCTAKKAPHIKVYPHGEGLDGETREHPSFFAASELKKALAEAESSLPEVITVIPKGTDIHQTDEVMQGVVANSILGEGNPMVLIVLSKREAPNLALKTIAAQFMPVGVKTLFISEPHQDLMAALQLTKLPAMLLMFLDDAADREGPPVNPNEKAMMTAPYVPSRWGPPTHQAMTEFVLSHLSHTSKGLFLAALNSMSRTAGLNGEALPPRLQRLVEQLGKSADGAPSSSSSSSSSAGQESEPATVIPFTGVQELTAEQWESFTGAASTTSSGVVPRMVSAFFLDRHADGFDSALKAAESAAQSAHAARGGSETAFVWVDAPCQEGFAKALGVSDLSGLPVLTAFSPRHKKSARFVGAWEPVSLSSFLKQALGGRVAMFPLEEDASLEAVDCAQRPGPNTVAGGDGSGSGAEEDGMDDLMAEILAEEAKAKQELEEKVANDLKEMQEAEASAAADKAKPKTKTVRRKRKKGSSGGASGEL